MLKIKIVLSAIVLAGFITFVSCSEDEKSQVAQNEQTTSEVLKDFSEKYVNISLKIRNEISTNKKINHIILNNLLPSVKNKTDLELALKKAGINNNIEVVNLLLQTAVLYNNFVNKNPSFKKLTPNEKQSLLSEEVKNVFEKITIKKINNIKLSSKSMIGRTCVQQYDIERGRCNQDAALCAVVVLAASWAAGPGYPLATAVGLAGCVVAENICDSRSIEDYEDCIGG